MTTEKDFTYATIPAPYRFTTEEQAELGKKIALRMRERADLEEQLGSIKADYKSKLESCDLSQSSLARKIQDGFEMRDTEVVIHFNSPAPGRKSIYDRQTSNFIKEEEMDYDDKQRTLPLKEATKPAPATPAVAEQEPEHVAIDEPEPVLTMGNEGAGETNLGDKLDQAAAQTEAPKIVLDLTKEDWKSGVLVKAAKKAMKAAGWTAVQISTLVAVLNKAYGIQEMIDSLRPHTIAPVTTEEAEPVTDEPPVTDDEHDAQPEETAPEPGDGFPL